MNIKKYKKKGEVFFKLRVYLGKDPLTKKDLYVNRQGFKSKKDAEICYFKLKHLAEKKYNKQNYTFEEVYDLWIEQYKLTVKESTIRSVLTMFKLHINPAFGKYLIDKIDFTLLQSHINDWSEKYKSSGKFKNYINRVFLHAMRLKIITVNPMDLVVQPKIKTVDDKEIKFWDKNTLLKFLSIAKKELPLKWYAFFHLLAYTGMRRGETLALHWQDIDFNHKKLHITKNLSVGLEHNKNITTPKTRKSKRTIELDDATLEILKKWKKEQGKSSIIFTNTKNDYVVLSYPSKLLYKIIKKHKLPGLNLHGFRHTHCSLLFYSGASIKQVQDRLGHSDIKTTMDIYTHLTKNKKVETINLFMNFMEN